MKEKKKEYECWICGDSGQVKRSYVSPNIPLPYANEMVPCPKCEREAKEKPKYYPAGEIEYA